MPERMSTPTLMTGIVAISLVFHSLQGQQSKARAHEPSLTETKKWIEQTFRDGSHIVNKAFQNINFDAPDDAQCYMTFEVNDQILLTDLVTNPRLSSAVRLRFWDLVNLADVDPTSIKAGSVIHDTDITTVKDPNQVDYSTHAVKDHPYVWVHIRTANDADRVAEFTPVPNDAASDSGRFKKTHTHEVGFPLEGIAVEPEYAPRLVSALRHAVELCGGKPSTF